MIKISNKSKIYLFAIANNATGGTESIHQLYYNLRDMGYNAFMYYKPKSNANPVNENYQKYDVEVADTIEDFSDNVFVVPEIATKFLYRYKKITKVIFWLSVDNYYLSLNAKNPKTFRNALTKILGYDKKFVIDDKLTHKNIYHISQSQYAIVHIKSKGIENVMYIPDYIHEDFSDIKVNFNSLNRKDVVLYNPAKGLEFTKMLISRTPNVKWLPLIDMTPGEVAANLQKSKVYVDFGNHPGKDRFPREAALMGCCIITGKKGSAYYDEDVNIPMEYKFDEEDIDAIINCISKCINTYDLCINDFEQYRNFISKHKQKLKSQIKLLFSVN